MEVEAGGYTFQLKGPDWQHAARAVELFLPLIGTRAEVTKMIDDLMAAVQDAGDDAEAQKKATLEIVFNDDAVRKMAPADIAELLGIVTDQDADWFLEPDRMDYDAMVTLLGGVAGVLPFVRVLGQKGALGMAFVNSWIESIAGSSATSENGAGGDPKTSPATELDGASASAGTSTGATVPGSRQTQ